MPGQLREGKALAYLESECCAIGLKPGSARGDRRRCRSSRSPRRRPRALIVDRTAPAAGAGDVVRARNRGPHRDAATADGNAKRAGIEGWMTLEAGHKIVALAGPDFATLELAAAHPGFARCRLARRRASR